MCVRRYADTVSLDQISPKGDRGDGYKTLFGDILSYSEVLLVYWEYLATNLKFSATN